MWKGIGSILCLLLLGAGHSLAATNEAALLTEGPEFQESRVELMRAANKSISMRYFMWKGDRAGLIHLAELWAAAERGVQVRVIMDGRKPPEGIPPELLATMLANPNFQLKLFNPISYFRPGDATYRQHDKFAIFESTNGSEALVGDVQPTNWHCRNPDYDHVGKDDYPSLSIDTYLRGPVVDSIQSYFEDSWNSPHTRTYVPPVKLTEAMKRTWTLRLKQVLIDAKAWVTGTHWRDKIHPVDSAEFLHDDNAVPKTQVGTVAKRVFSEISKSNKNVRIVSQYIVPTAEMASILRYAKNKKINVEFMTNSQKSLVGPAVYWFTRANHGLLADLGTSVYEWQGPEYLHMKLSIFDDNRTYIGSMHWDPRAQNLNNETGILIEDKNFAKTADALYVKLKHNSVPIMEKGKLRVKRPFFSTCLWLFLPKALRDQI